LDAEEYAVSAVDKNNGRLEIHLLNPQDIISALAYDVDRFGAATMETVAGIRLDSEIPQSRAWPLVRSYYAAFYAAHGLSRIFGRSITTLDRDQVEALRRAARVTGAGQDQTSAIHEGLYVFEVDVSNRLVVGQPLGRSPHEDTWRQFEKLLSMLEVKVLDNPGIPAVQQEVFGLLQAIHQILNYSQSAGNWLSKIRNNVNYRHHYGAWYPHGPGQYWSNVDTIFRSFLRHQLIGELELESKPIVRFTKGCALIVSLFHEMLRDLADRHPNNKSFLREKTIPVIELVGKTLAVV
jgi:hypothetical protein